MAALSFMESTKDRFSRLGGNAFSEHVEEATSELLLVQDPEKVAVLVHFGNQGGEHVPELLNAVRRRIDTKNPKVACFTVVLLDALIRNCGRDLHLDLAANQKGLLRDLVMLSAKESTREAEYRARELAATLIVNCSCWFATHPDEKIREVLGGLADHARTAGANLDGITPDHSFRVRLDESVPSASINGGPDVARPSATTSRPSQYQQQQRRAQQQHQQRQLQRQQHQSVVDAIPIVSPSEEALNGMMEAVLLFAECLSTTPPAEVPRNEMLNAIKTQISSDHELIGALVAVVTSHSNITIDNLETLRSVNDSQIEVLERHTELLLQNNPNLQLATQQQVDADEARAIAASLAEYQQAHPTGASNPAAATLPHGAATAAAVVGSMGTYRERLTRYYEFYNPSRLADVDSVLAKFEGREEQMMRQLQAKYGPEPAPPQPQPELQQQQHAVAAPSAVTSALPPQAPTAPVAAAAVPSIGELFAAATTRTDAPPPPPAPALAPAPPAIQHEQSDVVPVASVSQAPPPPPSTDAFEAFIADRASSTAAPSTRAAGDVDAAPLAAPAPQVTESVVAPPPAPAPQPAAHAAFPAMNQTMDPANHRNDAAMRHSDGPTAEEGQRASSRPKDDEDFDAFLNARLTS